MRWDPAVYSGVTRTRLDKVHVWTPDIFVQQDVGSDMSTGPTKYMTQVCTEYLYFHHFEIWLLILPQFYILVNIGILNCFTCLYFVLKSKRKQREINHFISSDPPLSRADIGVLKKE